MAQTFLAADREQAFLLPPDVREWPSEDHFAWFVIDAVDQMESAESMARIARTATGGRRLSRAMMVALVLYASARAIRSSRAIERAGDSSRRV